LSLCCAKTMVGRRPRQNIRDISFFMVILPLSRCLHKLC
jgi:hypothetical protein